MPRSVGPDPPGRSNPAMRFLRHIAAILACSATAGMVSAVFHPLAPPWFAEQGGPRERWRIDLSEARQHAAAGEVVWIDARTRDEFEQGHHPGAFLLNPEDWGELMFEHQFALQDAFGKPVVVYAAPDEELRAAEIAQRLRELLGLDPVHVLAADWREIATEDP